jgi:putative transposase
VRYACIACHRGEFPVRLMCRVLDVTASGFYAWRQRSPSAHRLADEVLMARVRIAHAESGRTYGAPRIHRELRAQGIRVGKKRVARLMQHEGIAVRRRRRFVRTTDSTHADPIAPNLLQRQFAPGPLAVNRVWVSDITYVPTREGWLYLATILDLASRRCVGWAMRDTLEGELAISALQMALTARQPAPGLIHHSDRGRHYAAAPYRALLAKHEAIASMSRRGNCWDNAVAESFFATLELELIDRHDWTTRAEARHAIFRFIETWYNPKRRHSTLGYLSPVEYERQMAA